MKPLEFFKAACKAGRYREKAWVFSVFGCQLTKDEALLTGKEWDIHRIDGVPYWVDADGEHQEFTDFTEEKNIPLLDPREDISLEPGDIPNLAEAVETTVGNYFLNWYCLVHSMGNKVPFQLGEISVKKILKVIKPLFTNDIVNPDGSLNIDAQDPTLIYVHEYVAFVRNTAATAGFVEVSVPSATPFTATVSPTIKPLREKLFKQYEGQLNDPTVIAKIEKELIAEDKKWIEQDPDRGFYIKGKSFNVNRKKLFLMGGIEESFNGDGTYTLVKTSLSEGMRVENMPAMINTMRGGAYSRGALTALGGEAVKFFQRVLQNATVAAEDCGVTYGIPYPVNADNHETLKGRYHTVSGETVAIGEDTKAFIGKIINLRSPMVCKLGHTDYCAKCMGDEVARSPTGLSAMGSIMGSIFMDSMMQATHGSALTVVDYDALELIA
ncbi:hypothetical protein pEaSNUABM54_00308 [Erwinia phage pEa_SNUABM_54]|nr:hypothetical protein pEaSNUABM54_00308 [Erwinia phage pEa_SNUABM_54]